MQFPYTLIWFLNTSIRSWILLYNLEYFFLEHFSVITKQHSWWHTFFHSNGLAFNSLMVKTGDNQCMDGTFKTLAQNQWETVKSPFKMEFYSEPRSQCRTCDYDWWLIQNKWEAVKCSFKMVHWTAICDYGWFTSFLTLYSVSYYFIVIIVQT